MALFSPLRFGFIGFGKMAEALVRGGLRSGCFEPKALFASDPSSERGKVADQLGITLRDTASLVAASDLIFVCVKPQQLKTLLANFEAIELKDKLMISIVAGAPTSVFRTALGKNIPFLRVMPNTPATVGEGMSVLAFSGSVLASHRKEALGVFGAIGKVQELDEAFFDVVTGLSGSGPAFFYRVADAFAQEAALEGLSYTNAISLAAQTMMGAGKMLLETGQTPAELVQAVASPGGTTEAGLLVMDQSSIGLDLRAVIKAAVDRSKVMAKAWEE